MITPDVSNADILILQSFLSPDYDVELIHIKADGTLKNKGFKTWPFDDFNDEELKEGGVQYDLNVDPATGFIINNLALCVSKCMYAAIARLDIVDLNINYDVTVGY